MKKNITTTLLAMLVMANQLYAHPGPPGHKHPEGDAWPFPPVEWSLVIASFVLLAVIFAVKKAAKW